MLLLKNINNTRLNIQLIKERRRYLFGNEYASKILRIRGGLLNNALVI